MDMTSGLQIDCIFLGEVNIAIYVARRFFVPLTIRCTGLCSVN